MRYICFRCKHIYKDPTNYCNFCLQVYSVIPIFGAYRRGKGVTSAYEIYSGVPRKLKRISGFEFLGKLPEKFSMMIHGMPGQGKSIFSLKFGNEISKSKRTLYILAEESISSDSLYEKIKEFNINVDNLFIEEMEEPVDIIKKYRQLHCSNLIIDSITSLWAGEGNYRKIERDLKYIKEQVNGITIFISQSTKNNKYRGASTFGHLVDIILKAENGIMSIDGKNRFGPHGEYIIWENPPVAIL